MSRLRGGLARDSSSTTLYLDLQLRADYPRGPSDAVDAVGDVALGHHRVLERDNHYLRLHRALPEELGEILRVVLVEVLVDLVEEVERVRVHLLDREYERDGRHGLFPSRHRGRLPVSLAAEVPHQVDASRERVVLVLELEPSFSVG